MRSVEPMRVLLDANVLISYLLTPGQNSAVTHIVDAAVLGEFQLLMPEELLDELEETVRTHEHLARRIPVEAMRPFVALLLEIAEIIPRITEPIPALTRDPEDDYLIAYALIGRAEYLVTGDRDLLVLERVESVDILTPNAFGELLSES
jgi:uncharacterized protein